MNQFVRPPTGITPLGHHVIADLFEARNLLDAEPAAEVLKQAAVAAGATVLSVDTHDFGDRAGFTGVVMLAESHISIHTWPEKSYAAVDIFMCGDAQPMLSLKVLEAYFQPKQIQSQVIQRGQVDAFERSVSPK